MGVITFKPIELLSTTSTNLVKTTEEMSKSDNLANTNLHRSNLQNQENDNEFETFTERKPINDFDDENSETIADHSRNFQKLN